jgi:hypothetical protein
VFGNGFSRHAIVNAYMLRARLDKDAEPKLSKAARELDDTPSRYRFHTYDGPVTFMCEALDALEFEDVMAFFCLLAARDNLAVGAGGLMMVRRPDGTTATAPVHDDSAITRADRYARVHDPAGVTIVVESSDDDPTLVTFHIADPIANAWADRHGSLDGGTWETSDGEDFVYDTTYWHEGLFEEIKKEGFDLDFSSYGEPDERDLAIVAHAADCEACQGDFSNAEKHFTDEPADLVAHEALAGKRSC